MDREFKGVWISKDIWLNEQLGWTEKLLLVEIDSLSDLGECFATNEYFAEFFGLSKDRISKLISSLCKKGFIESSLVYKIGTKQVEKRVITTRGYRRKQLEGIGENTDTPIGENAEDNNTFINNTNICALDLENFFNQVWELYPIKKGKGAVSKTQKQKLYRIGPDELGRAINRYCKDNKDTDKQFWKHGSTFFNSGYIDYLDANYEDKPKEQPKVVGYHEKIRLMNGGGQCQQ